MLDNSKIREEIKQKRLALSDSTYQSMSLSCFENLKQFLSQRNFQSVGIYVSLRNEVDTRQIIEYLWQNKKEVYVPKCLENRQMSFYKITSWDDLSVGYFGLLEPKKTRENNHLDLQIVPLIAYDKKGYRLGVGGGYYDRYMAKRGGLKVGLAFSFQELPFFTQPHDMKFDYVVNEKDIIKY